jgi:hypothetical protein
MLLIAATPTLATRGRTTAATTAAAARTTTAATTTATVTTEATATPTETAAAAPAALTITAVAAGNRLEAVVGGGGRAGLGLRVVVGPGLRVRRRGGRGGEARLGLAGLARDFDVDPLLGCGGCLVARVPLALACGVGGVIGDVGVAGRGAARGGGDFLGVAVGEDGRGALVDLGQCGISDCRVGLGLLLGLDRLGLGGLGSRLGLGEGGSVGNRGLLNLGD